MSNFHRYEIQFEVEAELSNGTYDDESKRVYPGDWRGAVAMSS